MIAQEGNLGRVFTLRLEDGDRIPDCIEEFAKEKGVEAAFCALLGGIGSGEVVSGPENGAERPIRPILRHVGNVHEAVAVGSIFPSEDGEPKLHMHAALGRESGTLTGCVRNGVTVWQVCEVVIMEIIGTGMRRVFDPEKGFAFLSAK
jgi:uncharacterized protein